MASSPSTFPNNIPISNPHKMAYVPPKPTQFGRTNKESHFQKMSIEVSILDNMIEPQIKYLKRSELICKFWKFSPSILEFKTWVFENWHGAN